MGLTPTDVVEVASEDDVHVAVALAKRYASTHSDVELVVRELAWNLVYHAGGGQLEISALKGGEGVCVVSQDRGPGLVSMRHRSGGPGLGLGLGAVQRHASEFSLSTRAGQGTRIEARIQWNCKSS
jgi:anti-sigma regulatory factor (Ser/Thr protein kinase)